MAGIDYQKISAILVDLAALLTRIGDPTGDILPDLSVKIGDVAQDLWTILGWEGALSLHNKLTAARALNLDDIPTILVDTADMQPRIPRIVCHMDFWSDPQDDNVVPITAAATNINLPNVIIAGLPAGITVIRVVTLLKIALIRTTSGADNYINNAAMDVAVDNDPLYGSTIPAINIPNASWNVDFSTSPDRAGDIKIGNINVMAEVAGNGTFYLRFENAQAFGGNLELHDVGVGLRVYFTV